MLGKCYLGVYVGRYNNYTMFMLRLRQRQTFSSLILKFQILLIIVSNIERVVIFGVNNNYFY